MMDTIDTMVAEMVGGIVMNAGGEVVYNLPNRKVLTIKVEDREPTDDEKREEIAYFLTEEIGLVETEERYDEPMVCLTLNEMLQVMDAYKSKCAK
jgi:hypothetical protein